MTAVFDPLIIPIQQHCDPSHIDSLMPRISCLLEHLPIPPAVEMKGQVQGRTRTPSAEIGHAPNSYRRVYHMADNILQAAYDLWPDVDRESFIALIRSMNRLIRRSPVHHLHFLFEQLAGAIGLWVDKVSPRTADEYADCWVEVCLLSSSSYDDTKTECRWLACGSRR